MAALMSEVSRRYESTTSFSLAALPFFPLALTCVADVLGCDGQDSCAAAARLNGFDDARAVVLANALAWIQIIMCSWTVFPFIFFALARTERLPQRVRTVAGAVVVLSAYGCWALVSGVGSFSEFPIHPGDRHRRSVGDRLHRVVRGRRLLESLSVPTTALPRI